MKPESSNRFTIGKQLRKAKALRKADPAAQIVQPDGKLKDYIQHLQSKGMVMKDLSVARFKTKNGLPYTGLITDKLFPTNKIFIRVPVECLLNTRVAFFSDITSLFVENPQYFHKNFHANWEDHILLAFLLYEFQKGSSSEWHHLLNNLPREIDYVVFWSQEELSKLEDPILCRLAKDSLDVYQKQTHQFIEIAQRYPHFFPPSVLTQENIRWLHIHLVTRCFGKYFEYTTMVPFAQLINHECTDVYYTMFYHKDNPHDTKEEFYEEKVLTEEEIDALDTSDGSYNSEELDDPEDRYLCQPISQIPKKPQREDTDVVWRAKDVVTQMHNSVNFGDNVSLGFLLEMHEAVEELRANNKVMGLNRLQGMVSEYVKRIKVVESKCNFTKLFHQIPLEQKNPPKTAVSESKPQPQKNVDYFPKEWQKDKFDQFLMLSSSKDQFQEHSQVFFCYGRLSNRMMLMRYGMTLEYNKYNHLYIHLPIDSYIEGYSSFPQLLKLYRLPKTKKIKVRRTKFCVQLLLFFRGLEWKTTERVEELFHVTNYKVELKVIERTKYVLQKEMSSFTRSLQDNEKSLYDPRLGYHQYFSTVYKVERQRILSSQILLLNVARVVVQRLSNGAKLMEAMLQVGEFESTFEMRINRLMMRKYFDCFFLG